VHHRAFALLERQRYLPRAEASLQLRDPSWSTAGFCSSSLCSIAPPVGCRCTECRSSPQSNPMYATMSAKPLRLLSVTIARLALVPRKPYSGVLSACHSDDI